MEPAVSEPMETIHSSEIVAAADPPEDPPGKRLVSQGFLVEP